MDWHTAFIILHTSFAAICLISGLYAVWPKLVQSKPWIFRVFFLSLIGLVVFVTLALASHWNSIDVIAKISFTGLVLLGLYMIYRGFNARQRLIANKLGNEYINDVGFVLISLTVGLIIVPLLRLTAPVWVSVLSVASVIIVGGRFLKFVQHKQ